MNLPPSRRLASFVEPALDERRIDRAWAAVSSRRVFAWPSWKITLVPALAVALVVALVVRARTPPAQLAGMVVEASTGQAAIVVPGAQVTLRDGARLRWDRIQADRVEATIERGAVTFDVQHDDARELVVHAAGVDVVDRGTRFVVDVEAGVVSVSVERGRVAIERSGATRVELSGGEAWTSGPTSPAIAPSTTALATSTASTSPAVPAMPAASTAGAASEEGAPSEPKAAAVEPPAVTPQQLLQTANEARLAGRPKDAAVAFDTLRRHFRGDPRAGLAAFELGRLRLDSLGDPSGAAEALADAVRLAPSGPFREDADARLVEAYDRMHDRGRCVAARQSYLTRYPRGLHAAAVTDRCP
jgi:transmembrane sensor